MADAARRGAAVGEDTLSACACKARALRPHYPFVAALTVRARCNSNELTLTSKRAILALINGAHRIMELVEPHSGAAVKERAIWEKSINDIAEEIRVVIRCGCMCGCLVVVTLDKENLTEIRAQARGPVIVVLDP